jgi:hypothetical protein
MYFFKGGIDIVVLKFYTDIRVRSLQLQYRLFSQEPVSHRHGAAAIGYVYLDFAYVDAAG